MSFRILCSALALFLASISSSQAGTITVTYSGFASGIINTSTFPHPVVHFDVTATETYVFDTDISPIVVTCVYRKRHPS
jgi:hypothetical protein